MFQNVIIYVYERFLKLHGYCIVIRSFVRRFIHSIDIVQTYI